MTFSYSSILHRMDTWIANEYRLPTGSLGAFRIAYAGYLLLVVGAPQFRWIAYYPSVFFDPPPYSLTSLASGFPDYFFFLALDIAVVALLVLLLFGFRARFTSLLLGVSLLIGFSFYHSFGKINHDTLLILITPFLMAFSGWGYYYSVERAPVGRIESFWPVTTLAILLGFAMFAAGVPKLVEDGSLQNGWLNLTTHAVKGYVINDKENLIAPILLEHGGSFLWESLDYAAVFFEMGFLLAVVRRTWFRFFILVAVFFHFANGLLLGISFVNNVALYLLFIDWVPILRRINEFTMANCRRVMVIATLVAVLAYVFYVPINLTAILTGLGVSGLLTRVLIMALVCCFFSINFLRGFRRRPNVASV